jgi:hypothetical protein
MEAIAALAGFRTLDWSDVYAAHDLATLRSSRWDFHPNVLGHEVIAARFLRDLRSDPVFGLPPSYLENR